MHGSEPVPEEATIFSALCMHISSKSAAQFKFWRSWPRLLQ